MKKNGVNATVNGISSTASTQCTNDQQWTKYHTVPTTTSRPTSTNSTPHFTTNYKFIYNCL